VSSWSDDISHMGSAFNVNSNDAWEKHTECPFCGAKPLAVVAYRNAFNTWLYCINCEKASVANADSFGRYVSPGRLTLPTPDGVPEGDASLWQQIRACLSVGASTAVAMLCRKMLLHLAHTHESTQNPNATPPQNFVSAVDYLKTNYLVPIQFHNWIDKIRLVGNEANHELPQVSEDDARDIALFTHNLLITLYELPKRANIASPMQPPGSPPAAPSPNASSGPTGVNPSGMA
jgi:hypothetical protein